MTHPVLAANPVWTEYERQGEVLRERRLALARHRLALTEPYDAAVQVHKEAVRAAVDAGQVPPVAPDPPPLRHIAEADALHVQEVQDHRARRDSVLAEIAGAVLEALADRERAGNARLAQISPEVRRLLAQRREDLTLYAMVLGAQDRDAGLAVHPSRADRVDRRPTVEALLSAAEADVTLFRIGEIPRPSGSKVVIDRGQDEPKARPHSLGMTGPARVGIVDRATHLNRGRGVEI